VKLYCLPGTACGAVQSADATRALIDGATKNNIRLRQVLGAAVLSASLVLGGTASRADTGPSQHQAAGAGLAIESLSSASVNGTSIAYLRAGSGPITIVLIHGWPESAYEWHKVIPELARKYTVIAVNLRGIGGSTPAAAGYDKANMAHDVRTLVRSLGLRNVYVFGHDIGGMVSYAYARSFPGELAGFGVFDVPLAGIDPWSQVRSSATAWHFSFHQIPGLAETLVADQQGVYFRSFYDRFAAKPGAITKAEADASAAAYASPAQLKAGFEWYRAFPDDEAFNKSHTANMPTPMLLIGGDKSFGPMLPAYVAGLRKVGVTNVRTLVVANSGHWIPEEQPAAIAAAIDIFVRQTAGPLR
jgi:pimeloyl-ACP methyl ester carboxylesterase